MTAARQELRIGVRIHIESDWHIGTGAGRPGSIDRLVARDEDGLPFIPGKSLTGIWRDGCEQLAFGLDSGTYGKWHRWVDRLFGDQPSLDIEDDEPPSSTAQVDAGGPSPAALQARPAHLPLELRSLLAHPDMAPHREAVTFTKPGLEMDAESGRAKDKTLRFIEMSRRAMVLIADDCSLALPADHTRIRAALSFLVAGASLATRTGGKRRRGAGRCRIEINGHSLRDAVEWLRAGHESAPEPPPPEVFETMPVPAVDALDGDWIVVPVRVLARQRLAIASATAGNVVESLDFIPGTYLLPIVASRLSDHGVDAWPRIAAGDIQVLPATLEADGQRSLPVPFSLAVEKSGPSPDQAGSIRNRLLEREGDAQIKALRAGFVVEQGAGTLPRLVAPVIESVTHNTIDDEVQRPTQRVGGVFTYEALAAGQAFRSEIRVRKAIASRWPAEWTSWIAGDATIGRSRKDDYGTIEIELAPTPPRLSSTVESAGEDGHGIAVWLTSDTILLDAALRPNPSPTTLAAVLEQGLGLADFGVHLQVHPLVAHGIAADVRTRRIESWNRGWQLPRPSIVAMAAGSCVAFRIEGRLDVEHRSELSARLKVLEASGIGERRGEGYGQIRINPPFLTSRILGWSPAPSATVVNQDTDCPDAVERTSPWFELARSIETTAWRAAIRRAALGLSGAPEFRNGAIGLESRGPRPTPSQLGALREAVRGLGAFSPDNKAAQWLPHLERRDRWPKATVETLKSLLRTQDRIWTLLGPEIGGLPSLTANGPAELRLGLWGEAVQIVTMACLRAHGRERPDPAAEAAA